MAFYKNLISTLPLPTIGEKSVVSYERSFRYEVGQGVVFFFARELAIQIIIKMQAQERNPL